MAARTVDDDHTPELRARAVDIVAVLKTVGVKLVCVDFDATFVRIHTGGTWTQSSEVLCSYVRTIFLLLLPMLCHADINVAIVTFSPQVQLIRQVLNGCFEEEIASKIIVRGDDPSWTLVHADTVAFMPLWQTNGRHLDRKYKLPFMISSALEVEKERGYMIRNKDTMLIDDDAMNVRVANDSGVNGVYFDPDATDLTMFCKQIQRLKTLISSSPPPPSPAATSTSGMTLRTPCKPPAEPLVRLLTTPDSKFIRRVSDNGGRRVNRGSNGSRTSKFSLCTPSPVLKLKCTVEMGRPRPKRATKLLRTYSKVEDDLQNQLPLFQGQATLAIPLEHCPSTTATTPTKQPPSTQVNDG